jgi:hypothetical protein
MSRYFDEEAMKKVVNFPIKASEILHSNQFFKELSKMSVAEDGVPVKNSVLFETNTCDSLSLKLFLSDGSETRIKWTREYRATTQEFSTEVLSVILNNKKNVIFFLAKVKLTGVYYAIHRQPSFIDITCIY